MSRIRFAFGIVKEVFEFAAANRAWWLVPIFIIILAVAALMVVGQGATPLIYTLF